MEPTGERFVPQMGLQIALEHWHRYYLAASRVRGKVVVDIACGEGYGSALLAREAKSVVGIDIDKETVLHALNTYFNPNLTFLQAEAVNLPFADASVDVVVSFETIEHLSREEQILFLEEVQRILRPDGEFIVSSPDKTSYSEMRNLSNPFHKHELESDEFKSLMEERFENVKISKQRAGFFSLVNSGRELKSYAISADIDGIYSKSSMSLTFEYSIAMCSRRALPSRGFGESVNFDTRLLTNLLDPITEKLLESSAVAQERAEEIAALIRLGEQEREYLEGRLLEASALSQERAEEISALIYSRELEKRDFESQLLDASAVAQERAEQIVELITSGAQTRADLETKLLEASAVAQERAEQIAGLLVREADTRAVLEDQLLAASAVAQERAEQIAGLLVREADARAVLENQLLAASAVAQERAEEIASIILSAQRERIGFEGRLLAASAVAQERAQEIAAFITSSEYLKAELLSVSTHTNEQAKKINEISHLNDILSNENTLLRYRLRPKNYIRWLLGHAWSIICR